MTLARRAWAQAVVVALLAPVLALALSCQAPARSAEAAMACCRGRQSTCMHGEHAGSMACCSQVAATPVMALPAPSPQPVRAAIVAVPAPAAAVAAQRSAAALTALAAETPPLYTLHASLLI